MQLHRLGRERQVILATICIVATLLVVLLTAHAWHDYHAHPEKYGYRPNERTKRRRWLTQPARGDTRQPVRHWTARWVRR